MVHLLYYFRLRDRNRDITGPSLLRHGGLLIDRLDDRTSLTIKNILAGSRSSRTRVLDGPHNILRVAVIASAVVVVVMISVGLGSSESWEYRENGE